VKKTFRRYYTRNMSKALMLWHEMEDPDDELKALREKIYEETRLYPRLNASQPYMDAELPYLVEKYGDAFHPKRENWEPIRGDIEFDDVTFRYPDGGDNVLEHFNLHIPAGTTVAIVGETGAGKSTLVNLACRFFEPTQGQILIDGRDYRERSQLWLHSNIGYVLQSPHLFSGSVRENIRYGRLDASDAEIEAAAREAAERQRLAADAAWREALEAHRRNEAAPDAAAPAAETPDAGTGRTDPVGAILDALPEQILEWFRAERGQGPAEVVPDAVLDDLDAALIAEYRASRITPTGDRRHRIAIAA